MAVKTSKKQVRRKRGRKDIPSTRGWSKEFREKILQELDECGDPIQVAYQNRVEVSQVMKCVAREKHSRRRLQGSRSEFLERVDRKAQAGLLLALEKLAGSDDTRDAAKLAELCRKVLENTKTFAKDAGSKSNVNIINVKADVARVDLLHMTQEQLENRAREVLVEIEQLSKPEEDRSLPGASVDSGGGGREEEPEEPAVHPVP